MVPVTIGILTIIMSLFTKYEFSIFKLIGMNTHLVIDLLAGVFLAASPWILNFSDQVYLPHLIVGIIETLVVLISETKPFISANEQSFGNPHVRKI
jgi:membrane protein DedA with SNARE-associated domain